MRILLIFVMIGAFFLTTSHAFADTNCLPIYGGGQSCTTNGISIEKDVVNPQTQASVHDLGQADPMFVPGQTVTFHITITNNGTDTVNNATITDIFPTTLHFVSGPGNFNLNNRQLTFPVSTLTPGASQTFTVTGTVDGSQLYPGQPTCVSNIAYVSVDNESTQDTSQFCMNQPISAAGAMVPSPPISTQAAVLGTTPTQSPATGASNLEWMLLAGAGISGITIKKFQSTRYKIQTNSKFQNSNSNLL